MEMSESTRAVNEILPAKKLFSMGLQHVLIMYAGAIAVPLILANSMGMSKEDSIILINACLLTSGLATLLQCLGIKCFGARLPLIQGCSFIVLAPLTVIGQQYGFNTVIGATISCGLFTVCIAPIFSRLVKFFPPVVIGSVITIIGISLMPAAAIWIGGGDPDSADFGTPANLLLALATLIITMLIYARTKGFFQSLSVLFGLTGGTLLATIFGLTDFSHVSQTSWIGITTPFMFGLPEFKIMPILVMCLSMTIVMTETTGNVLLIDKIIGQPTTQLRLANTLRADGLSTMIGGCLNSFPYNAFSQNAGLLLLTNVKSRYVVATSGLILIVLGVLPKLGAVIACIPTPVLGGVGILMFGMTVAAGIKELSNVNFSDNGNGLIVGLSICIGVIPVAFSPLFQHLAASLKLILESGIFIGGATAVILNVALNGVSEPNKKHKEN